MNEDKTLDVNDIIEEKKMGLELSDTAYYHVNDGLVAEIPGDDEQKPDKEKEEKPKKKTKRKKRGHILAFLLGAVCCLAVMFVFARLTGPVHLITDAEYDYYSELDDAYGKYYEIMTLIGQDPLAEKIPEDISDEELKQIVSSIGDPYAEYYTPQEYKELMKRYQGDYVGVGIGVTQEDENIVIKTIFEDTPAAEAGLKEEDVILKVDGKTPENVDDAVNMIGGEAGTNVTITIKRGDEVFDIELTRAKIETDSVAWSPLDGHSDIGYIYISSFIQGTDDEFKEAVKDLQSQGCDKFIIDLRNNGGGLTDSSIEIADYLLPACTIMSESTKDGQETVYNSKASSADLDLVILVNENTASASEILTAALQDNDAGPVIGTTTYGKGVTQIVHMFEDGSAVKVTATEYFRPNGDTVHEVGITPDIEASDEEAIDTAIRELEQ